MIPYEELDRALARWKARSQGGAAVDAVPDIEAEAETSSPAPMEVASEETPLPPIDLGSFPEPAPGGAERTGEIDIAQIESYEED
jgi:hypothetical protein